MGLPQVRFSLALVVFVLTPEGRIETIDGGSVGADKLSLHLRRAGARPTGTAEPGTGGLTARALGFERLAAGSSDGALERLLSSEVAWRLPLRLVTSRFRPLMPRLSVRGELVLPLWTTGRLTAEEQSVALASSGLRFQALERLAESLDDDGLVLEAQSEFRRAITGDPIVAELLSESRRARSLAANELARLEIDGEIPPVFALLPERFTINQLRDALAAIARVDGGEIEASSTFRRKVGELVKQHAMFTPLGEEPSEDARGRPPMAYRFDPGGWRRWLFAQIDERRSSAPGVPPTAAEKISWLHGRGAPPDPSRAGSAAPSQRMGKPHLPRFDASARSAAAEEGGRVAKLESDLRHLSEELNRDRRELHRLMRSILASQAERRPRNDAPPEADAP